MQTELIPDDLLIRPMVGEEIGLDYDQARAKVQDLLDRAPQLAPVAAAWRKGPKDDTVYAGPFTWTVFAYEGDDPRSAALAWLEDYAATIRAAGVDVQVAGWPGRR
jgi:hypothetical protein